jgi:hypothetical protein
MDDSTRELLGKLSSTQLVAMRDKAQRAANNHKESLRMYMAELCDKRAADCAALLAEREP